MKRSTKLATVAITAATAFGLVAAPANAQSADRGLYPPTGEIYLNPLATKILGNSPVGDIAGAGADLVLNTVGPSTTVAVLNTIRGVVNRPLHKAAQYPNGRVTVSWQVTDVGITWRSESYYN